MILSSPKEQTESWVVSPDLTQAAKSLFSFFQNTTLAFKMLGFFQCLFQTQDSKHFAFI